jgi:hypothetical protein
MSAIKSLSADILFRNPLVVSIALYVISLVPDAFCVGNCWSGIGILLFGPLGFVGNLTNAVWIANPILFFSWAAMYKGNKIQAGILSLIALIIGIAFLCAKSVVTGEDGFPRYITDAIRKLGDGKIVGEKFADEA